MVYCSINISGEYKASAGSMAVSLLYIGHLDTAVTDSQFPELMLSSR